MYRTGQEVRLITDILDENGVVIVRKGTTFYWDDDSGCQLIEGELIYVEWTEVKAV